MVRCKDNSGVGGGGMRLDRTPRGEAPTSGSEARTVTSNLQEGGDNAQDGLDEDLFTRLDQNLPPRDLVPGDIIFLAAGSRVPADCRVLHCTDDSEVDQAALTGESLPEVRTSEPERPETNATEAKNCVFFGTLIIKGSLTCVVHSTGDNTLLGKIAKGIKRPRPKSSLEIAMEHFVHLIAVIAIIVGIMTAICEYGQGKSPRQILETSSAAMFGQIPEGLLPTATISLLIASYQMADNKVLVRKLDAVETLGCVDVGCGREGDFLVVFSGWFDVVWGDGKVRLFSLTGGVWGCIMGISSTMHSSILRTSSHLVSIAPPCSAPPRLRALLHLVPLTR